jgi:hypothetical protein
VTKTYESRYSTVQFSVLKHLKVVEIRCHKEDEVVCQIVKIKLMSKLLNVPTIPSFLQVSSCYYFS